MISYDREMRARAKADGKTLASFDSEADGCRMTTQGPASVAQARFAMWCGMASMVLSDRQLDEIRRDLKRKVDRARKKRSAGGEA